MGAHFVVLSSHGHVNGLTGAASAAGALLLIVHPAFASITSNFVVVIQNLIFLNIEVFFCPNILIMITK